MPRRKSERRRARPSAPRSVCVAENARKGLTILLSVWAAATFSGCTAAPEGRIAYYAAPRRDLMSLRSVAMLPLVNETDHPAAPAGLAEELFQAVQGRRLFHIRAVSPEEAERAALPAATGPLTLQDLARLRRSLGADAVLAGALTRWEPYPRMQVGLFLRLVDLRTGRVLWALDHVWDTTEATTQHRLRRFFADQMGAGAEPMGWELATASPQAFRKFVAWEAASTLPAPPPASGGRSGSRLAGTKKTSGSGDFF